MKSTLMLSKPRARAGTISSRVTLEGLHAMNGLLDFGFKILNAHAEAIEAQPTEDSRCAGAVTRGSTSMPISASGAKVKLSRETKRSSICAGVRYVGVPPPQWNCTTWRSRETWRANASTSV